MTEVIELITLDPNPVDDGSMGVLVGPSWSTKWTAMAQEDRDRVFARAAQTPLLTRHQATAILQGIPPDLTEPFAEIYVLDDAAPAAERLRDDQAHGRLQTAMTPVELISWAAAIRVALPDSFTCAAGRHSIETATPNPTQAPAPLKPKAGRPSMAARDKRIHESARQMIDNLAANGAAFKKDNIAEQLAPQYGVSESRMSKILAEANLDWPTAKDSALRAREKSPKG